MRRTVVLCAGRPSYLVRFSDEEAFRRVYKTRQEVLTDAALAASVQQLPFVELLSETGHEVVRLRNL